MKKPEVSKYDFSLLKLDVDGLEKQVKCLEYGGHEWITRIDNDVSQMRFFCRKCKIEHCIDKPPVIKGTIADLDKNMKGNK